ncbi:MAG: lipopolysaccharide heptosyltransferase I [SAR86 cluster bacterium]|uniref:Lipopolysaccharide heptosyltransferase 1 n=1 Tax=SAR86 cluster bacterium TaxID=2030880 RepID=A0A2A5B259_9GAMM|nr:MAG: lipopolysaccharide heptosyltransferase I [SAR86 cluster bacterium]
MRVLIVKVSSLGDIIHTLPAVTDAHNARKDIVFDWVVEENFVEVPGWHPAVDKVIPIAMRRWRRNIVKTYLNHEIRSFKKLLQGEHYDLVIDAQGLIKSGVISRMSKGLTIGLSNRTIREPMATLFYNKVYSVPWTEHAVDRVRQLFSRALQYEYDKDIIDYGIDVQRIGKNDSENSDSEESPSKKVIFLHGTTWHTKHWPEYYWRQLAHIATNSGFEVLLPWGDETEKQRAEFISEGNSKITVLGKQSLSGLANHIQQSEGVISVDTGLGHLAAALAKPTVSLYGPTNPGLSGTFGNRQLHLNSNLNCAPCVKKVCSYTGPGVTDEYEGTSFAVMPPCFSSYRPEMVWQQFEKLIEA